MPATPVRVPPLAATWLIAPPRAATYHEGLSSSAAPSAPVEVSYPMMRSMLPRPQPLQRPAPSRSSPPAIAAARLLPGLLLAIGLGCSDDSTSPGPGSGGSLV